MKHTFNFKILLLMFGLTFLYTQCEKQVEVAIDIPDTNFIAALIKAGVDMNGDGVISKKEASKIVNLDVMDGSISDMTGIENFGNLEILSCGFNQLTTLDVSNNAALLLLDCPHNQLTSLDISNNTGLTSLSCYFNQLTSLDISNNTSLEMLMCYFNQLSSLDISNNVALEYLDCGSNQLTTLDLTNNTALTWLWCNETKLTALNISHNTLLGLIQWTGWTFKICYGLDISDIPTLEEVCVRTMPFPPEGFILCMDGSPNVYFTTECSQ